MVSAKFFAIFFLSMLGLLQMCPAPVPILGAVARGVGSAVARSGAREVAKQAAKDAAKDAAKETAENAAEDAVNEAAGNNDDDDDSDGDSDGSVHAVVASEIAIKVRRADFLYSLRPRALPAGISQESIDLCSQQVVDQKQNQGIAVLVKQISKKNVRFDNVPAACMNLATVLSGKSTQEGGAIPTPMGSASLEYKNLSDAELRQIKSALSVVSSSSTSSSKTPSSSNTSSTKAASHTSVSTPVSTPHSS